MFLYTISAMILCVTIKDDVAYYRNSTCEIRELMGNTNYCVGLLRAESGCVTWLPTMPKENYHVGKNVSCIVINIPKSYCLISWTPPSNTCDYNSYMRFRKNNAKKITEYSCILMSIFMFIVFFLVLVELRKRKSKYLYVKIEGSESEEEDVLVNVQC